MTRVHESCLFITTDNCEAVTGMSWDWVRKFARVHGVPVHKVSRKHLVSARELEAAVARAAAAQHPAEHEAERRASQKARLRAEIADELRRLPAR